MRLYLPLFAGAAMLLCGCPNPNTYTVPRTLDPGKLQVLVAPEVIGLTANAPCVNNSGQTTNCSESAVLPMVPTVGIRYGAVERFDFGIRIPNLDSLAADGKIQLLRGPFDIALDPGLQFFYIAVNNVGAGVVYFHLPVLLGVNLNEMLSIVASPGVTYTVATATATGASGTQAGATSTGLSARLGLGLNIRVAKNLSLQPEVTVLKGFGDANLLLWVGGIGFNIGAQPNYSDMSGETPPASTPAASPAATPAPAPASTTTP
jgi:hypothetical protein